MNTTTQKTKVTTTFISEVAKARSKKALMSLLGGRFKATNPKTFRRWNRALIARCDTLKLKETLRIPRTLLA